MVKIHLARDLGLNPGSGRYPGEGNGNPLQYSCWEFPWTEEPGGGFMVTKSRTWLSNQACTHARAIWQSDDIQASSSYFSLLIFSLWLTKWETHLESRTKPNSGKKYHWHWHILSSDRNRLLTTALLIPQKLRSSSVKGHCPSTKKLFHALCYVEPPLALKELKEGRSQACCPWVYTSSMVVGNNIECECL